MSCVTAYMLLKAPKHYGRSQTHRERACGTNIFVRIHSFHPVFVDHNVSDPFGVRGAVFIPLSQSNLFFSDNLTCASEQGSLSAQSTIITSLALDKNVPNSPKEATISVVFHLEVQIGTFPSTVESHK